MKRKMVEVIEVREMALKVFGWPGRQHGLEVNRDLVFQPL